MSAAMNRELQISRILNFLQKDVAKAWDGNKPVLATVMDFLVLLTSRVEKTDSTTSIEAYCEGLDRPIKLTLTAEKYRTIANEASLKLPGDDCFILARLLKQMTESKDYYFGVEVMELSSDDEDGKPDTLPESESPVRRLEAMRPAPIIVPVNSALDSPSKKRPAAADAAAEPAYKRQRVEEERPEPTETMMCCRKFRDPVYEQVTRTQQQNAEKQWVNGEEEDEESDLHLSDLDSDSEMEFDSSDEHSEGDFEISEDWEMEIEDGVQEMMQEHEDMTEEEARRKVKLFIGDPEQKKAKLAKRKARWLAKKEARRYTPPNPRKRKMVLRSDSEDEL